jgi:nuclear factor I
VILRPGEQLASNPGHDPLSIQRYSTHPATRLVSVNQSRPDEVLLQHNSNLASQAVSPGTVFYQHSPSGAPDVNQNTPGDQQAQHQHQQQQGNAHSQQNHNDSNGSANGNNESKYSDQVNGHDTLSDFVTFVCQETDQNGQNPNHVQQNLSRSPKSQQYPQYNHTMLPPPPLPPMARPVAIIRSSDLTMVNSPPTSITPPTTMSSPHQEHQDSQMAAGSTDLSSSPPLSPQSQMDRKSLTRIASPYSTGREYTFNHFHSQPAQVSFDFLFIILTSSP